MVRRILFLNITSIDAEDASDDASDDDSPLYYVGDDTNIDYTTNKQTTCLSDNQFSTYPKWAGPICSCLLFTPSATECFFVVYHHLPPRRLGNIVIKRLTV